MSESGIGTRSIARCAGCGKPYLVRTASDGHRYPVGISECRQCGGTEFTPFDPESPYG